MTSQTLFGLWIVVTLGHFFHTAVLANRVLPPGRTRDERIFHAILAGVGTLLLILHVTALVTGLSLSTALAALATWHLVVAGVGRRRSRGETHTDTRAGLTVAESAAVAVACALVGSWVTFAARSAVVTGTDAASYHVPNAINLALGSSPLDLPATQHLYPMAGSMAGAWFVLPSGNPLLVDLAMCLPFLLLAASVQAIFRWCTGASGLAWASWMVLLLFSTPLFRISSLVSADLWFAAGFMAFLATLVGPWTRRTWRASDVLLLALAGGILVGAKTTGLVASCLLILTCLAASLLRRPAIELATTRWRVLVVATAAAVLTVGAGGLWLVRNWLLFGSPLAPNGLAVFGLTLFPGEPLAPTEYLSVLGDLRDDPSYSLAARTGHYIRLWLDRWYVVLLLPALLVPADLVFGDRNGDPARAARAFLLAATVVAGGALTWMLVGAPWTSLEWTRGLALRYALPVLVLAPLLALVGVFPTTWRWFMNRNIGDAVALAIVPATVLLFYERLARVGPRAAPVPDLTPTWLVAGALVVAVGLWVRRRSLRVQLAMAILAVVGLVVVWAPELAARSGAAREAAEEADAAERAALADGRRPLSEAREVQLQALDDPRRAVGCATRRVFSLGRLDEPLVFQDPRFRAIVYYAGWDVALTRTYGPIGECDYILTSEALQGTEKGADLVRVLAPQAGVREVARTERFVLLARR